MFDDHNCLDIIALGIFVVAAIIGIMFSAAYLQERRLLILKDTVEMCLEYAPEQGCNINVN